MYTYRYITLYIVYCVLCIICTCVRVCMYVYIYRLFTKSRCTIGGGIIARKQGVLKAAWFARNLWGRAEYSFIYTYMNLYICLNICLYICIVS